MDDSAGQTVGEYAAQIDQLGSPQPPSRRTSLTMQSTANANADAKASPGNNIDKGHHLQSLNAIMTGRRSSLNSRTDQLDRQRSYSIKRRASDVAAYDRRSSALVAGFSKDRDDYNLLPSLWWFPAAAFPMFASTLGPVASAFSICALVWPWRQEILPGETIESATFIEDPIW